MSEAIETRFYDATGTLLSDDAAPAIRITGSAPDAARYRVEILPDYYPESPRDMTDVALTEIVTWRHDRHGLGDRGLTDGESAALEHGGWEALRKHLQRATDGLALLLPISGIDHSGISLWIASGLNETSPMDTAGWDSGQWGFLLVTAERAREVGLDPAGYGAETAESPVNVRLGFSSVPVTVSRIEASARAEFAEYAAYVGGDVYGYSIEKLETWTKSPFPLGTQWRETETRTEWETVGGCSGFYGSETANLAYVWESAESELLGIISAENAPPIAAHDHIGGIYPNYCRVCGANFTPELVR